LALESHRYMIRHKVVRDVFGLDHGIAYRQL